MSPRAGSSHLFYINNGKAKKVEVLVKGTFKTEQMSNWLVKFENELFYKLLTIQTKVSCIYLTNS